MPTGYTDPVQRGKVTTLAQYAMTCARAFGALILLRDEASDAPIPDHFEPSNHHVRAIAGARRELARIEGLAPTELQRECQAGYRARLQDWKRECDRHAVASLRYRSMLSLVEGWVPPSPRHVGLQDFMATQLRESIDFDCRMHATFPQRLRWEDWRAERIEQLQTDIRYHTKRHAEEVERTEERNIWLWRLRESLQGGA